MSCVQTALLKSTRGPFLILTPICIFLGLAITYQLQNSINPSLAVLVMIAALGAHISVNTFNEYFDFTSGLDALTDKTPFSGGSGGLVECPQAKNAVLTLAVASLAVTVVIGLYFISLKGRVLLYLGVIGVLIILAYTRLINKLPLLCLITPGLAFGPLFILGTYFALSDTTTLNTSTLIALLAASAVPFFLVNNLLLINQLPDIDADKQVGRNTFPIAYGAEKSRYIYLLFILLCAAAIVVSYLVGSSAMVLLTLAPLLLLGLNVFNGIAKANYQTEQMIPFMGKNVVTTLLSIFLMALLIAISASL